MLSKTASSLKEQKKKGTLSQKKTTAAGSNTNVVELQTDKQNVADKKTKEEDVAIFLGESSDHLNVFIFFI